MTERFSRLSECSPSFRTHLQSPADVARRCVRVRPGRLPPVRIVAFITEAAPVALLLARVGEPARLPPTADVG